MCLCLLIIVTFCRVSFQEATKLQQTNKNKNKCKQTTMLYVKMKKTLVMPFLINSPTLVPCDFGAFNNPRLQYDAV